jgi:mannose-6-phosphate isomerase
MEGLYPLKFRPIFQEKIWGGKRLQSALNKDISHLANCGESWELSGVEGFVSEVSNGYLEGNNLEELIEIYMGDLVGEKVYQNFGVEFPLLIKYIDAEQDLSIQVHPNDELSKERHNAYGKTEMWYVVEAVEGSLINSGFNQPVTRDMYLDYFSNGHLIKLLNYDEVNAGDVFFIPAGRVHAIGKGVLLAEIQQTSDVTYRIYDYNRRDANGNERELHTELALDAIEFNYQKEYKTRYTVSQNVSSEIVSCSYFTTNILKFDRLIEKNISQLDSFIIYLTLEGNFEIRFYGDSIKVLKGETVLIPASLESYQLIPLTAEVKTLEVYIS